MTDDLTQLRALVARLRDHYEHGISSADIEAAADALDAIQAERDEHERMRTVYVISSQEEHARAEAAESRVEALSAEVGKLTEALEPFSVIAGEYFAQNLNRDDIVASIKRPDGTRLDITAGHLFDARAALDKGAAR